MVSEQEIHKKPPMEVNQIYTLEQLVETISNLIDLYKANINQNQNSFKPKNLGEESKCIAPVAITVSANSHKPCLSHESALTPKKISGEYPPSPAEANGLSAGRPYLGCETLFQLPEMREKEDVRYTPLPENKEGHITPKKTYACVLVNCCDSTSPSRRNQEGRRRAAGAGNMVAMSNGRPAGTEGAVISATAGTDGGIKVDVAKASEGATQLEAVGGKVGGEESVDQQPPSRSYNIEEKGAGMAADRDLERGVLELSTPSFFKFHKHISQKIPHQNNPTHLLSQTVRILHNTPQNSSPLYLTLVKLDIYGIHPNLSKIPNLRS